MVAGPIRTEAQSLAPIRTGNNSTFFASPEGLKRGTKSRTNQNWKQVHVAVDPPFTDCTRYLPRPLVAVPISLVLMQTVPACRSQTDAASM